MKRLSFGLLLVALLALPQNTQCRIGETLEQCKTRYGKPMEIKKYTALFFKNAGLGPVEGPCAPRLDRSVLASKTSKTSVFCTTSQAAKMGRRKWRINGGALFFWLIFARL
jgi:hypothetical protein